VHCMLLPDNSIAPKQSGFRRRNMDSNEKDKSGPLHGFAKDHLTVSHVESALLRNFTVSHLAEALGNNAQAQTTNTQQPQNHTTSAQTQQGQGEATGEKEG